MWLAACGAFAALAAEWMRAPGLVLTLGLVLLAGLAAAAAWREPLLRIGAALAVLVALIAAWSFVHLRHVTRDWADERETRIGWASRRLGAELDAAVSRVRGVAARAAPLLERPRQEAFAGLPGLLQRAPSEGVVLFDAAGRPSAWAGVQRVELTAPGPELSALTTPFYLWLVARRHTERGTAVAALLLARHAFAPAGEALTDRFQRRTGTGLRFHPAATAPATSDVYDYVLREGAGAGDTLFAVQPTPPEQLVAWAEARRGSQRVVIALVALLLVAAAAGGARRGTPTGAAAAAGAALIVVIARAPLQETFGPNSLFGPATYYRAILGPFSASAGALLVTGATCVLLASALWRRGFAPRWWTWTVAVVGVLIAPYLLQTLARGITPPASGVTIPLWLSWQGGIMLAASAVVLVAAALVRGRVPPAHAGPWPYVAGALAVLAAVVGLWLWEPRGAWPEWYTYLWVPSLFLALRPMSFRGMLATVAVVAGSAAALLTWGATTEGRMALAHRDLEALGDRADPVGVALLDRLAAETAADSLPASAPELYLLWRRSALGAQGYPASLATWSPSGDRVLSLDLSEFDLPAELVEAVAGEAWRLGLPVVRPVLRVPGLFAIAALPLGGGVVTVVVGPRTRLAPPSRVAQFLGGGAGEPEQPYEVVLSPPLAAQPLATGITWTREGWEIRGERALELPGGLRHAHGLIDLRGPSALLQRGILALAVDVAALLLLWGLLEVLDGRVLPGLAQRLPRALRSLRLRLAASLAAFFLVPTLVFAAWSAARLAEEFREARALLLQRTLRDAAAALDPYAGQSELAGVSRRVDADLFLSDGGVLRSASAPVLADLGVVDRLVPASAYVRLAFGDDIVSSVEQPGTVTPILVGYRLLARTAPGEALLLGGPELLTDVTLRQREADLGMAVLVGLVLGVLAALVLAGLAARALAHPLQRLRGAALALGSGAEPEPLGARAMPLELEPVRTAIAQAARDVEQRQQAQRVLAWGEMARQVAHEIKNPLTPIRLGIQHLLRLRRERAELGDALEEAGGRILREIDRLDDIARTFSRFALPVAERGPLGAVDVSAAAHDVIELYKVGRGGVTWTLRAEPHVHAQCRRDELVEVLVNLCENARDAGATHVTVYVARQDRAGCLVDVSDDGRGIPPELLPRIFEPRFSTTTSGAGLGLAIAKRLVEGWGGTIEARSEGRGATVMLRLEER